MSSITPKQTILIVEDSDDDYETTEIALRESRLSNPIMRCETGEDTLEYLAQFSTDSAESRPGIILLDLNMPGIGGRRVLETIKADSNLRDIPVIILTTSTDDRDIKDCYHMGANTYISKPVDLTSFMDAIKRLKEYWFEIAILPRPTL